MIFTLFPSDNVATGKRIATTWDTLCRVICHDPPQPRDVPKKALALWSPAVFKGNHRSRSTVEAVHALGFDVDVAPVPTESELRSALAGQACMFHSSSRATPSAPRWRLLLQLARPVTAREYDALWSLAAKCLPFAVGTESKDPSRGWYMPRAPSEGDFVGVILPGAPLDVDAALQAAPAPEAPHAPSPPSPPSPATDRRRALALALGAAWPAKGRHGAQLALAGALRAEGWDETEAVDFLCAVCRAAGDEDRPKREATVRHTWGRAADEPITGWTRLKSHVDGVLVDAARGALGRAADWTEQTTRRLAEIAAPRVKLPHGDTVKLGAIEFERGGFDADLPPIDYQIEGVICRADVVMFVAHGNSLKTWLAFSLALSVASGRPWLGRFVAKKGRAALLDFESARYEVKRRMKLLGARDADVEDRLLCASYPSAKLIDPETWIGLAGHDLELVVVDSFNAASPDMDENDARAALMIQHAGRFADATGCTVLFIHHARKGDGGDQREAVRGSTALYAACDRVFRFVDLEKKDGGVVLSTMRSIKDGAGRAPADVRVELSDQGLKYTDAPLAKPESQQDGTVETFESAIVELLRKAGPSGANRETVIDAMPGEKTRRRELVKQALARLSLASRVVEHTLGKQKVLTLNSSAER